MGGGGGGGGRLTAGMVPQKIWKKIDVLRHILVHFMPTPAVFPNIVTQSESDHCKSRGDVRLLA